MKQFEIGEVVVEANGQLSVYPLLPPREGFEHIYRAAMEVSWDPASKRLVTPSPRQWGPADWFIQIVRAVQSEYGVRLYVSAATRFVNVSPAERQKIESLSAVDNGAS